MAISATHFAVIRRLADAGQLPQGGRLLEIGEANWYYDDAPGLDQEICRRVPEGPRRDQLLLAIADLTATPGPGFRFDLIKLIYQIYWAPSGIDSIDFDGTPAAWRLDLNEPLALADRYATVINHGTAEHVFNIGQVFRTMHDAAQPGGLMIHESPFTGWIEHGFYALQPTLFFDLAEVNGYRLLGMYIQDFAENSITQINDREQVYVLAREQQLPANSMLLTALQKASDERSFQIPLQGVYRAALSAAGMEAWRTLR